MFSNNFLNIYAYGHRLELLPTLERAACTTEAGGQGRDTALQTAERLWVLVVHHWQQLSLVQIQGTLRKRWQNECKSWKMGKRAVKCCPLAMYMTLQRTRWHSQDLYVMKIVGRQVGILRSYPEWRSYQLLMVIWEGRGIVFRSVVNDWFCIPSVWPHLDV